MSEETETMRRFITCDHIKNHIFNHDCPSCALSYCIEYRENMTIVIDNQKTQLINCHHLIDKISEAIGAKPGDDILEKLKDYSGNSDSLFEEVSMGRMQEFLSGLADQGYTPIRFIPLYEKGSVNKLLVIAEKYRGKTC